MKRALFVGIDKYPKIPLTCCKSDASALADILECNEDGSPNFSNRILLDIKKKGELKNAIKKCFSGDVEVELFYFSGHGVIDAIGGYLVTPDYEQDDWGVSMQEILSIVNKSNCKNKVVILDCCHAGYLGKVCVSEQSVEVIQEGVTILTASKSDESAYGKDGQSVFTKLLLEALEKGAADITGHITASGIYAYIDKALGPWDQRPVYKTNITQFMPLRTIYPQVELSILRRIPEYFVNPDDEYPLDPSFEDTNSPDIEHKLIQPYSNPTNIRIFKELQKLANVGLVAPCGGENHMYYAAINSKSCKLTSSGQRYWRIVKRKNL
jgi:hypothetical protein